MTDRADLEGQVAHRLLPLARSWRRLADRALSDLGISTATGWALVHVARLGGDVRQTDLAAEMEITNASLVRLVDQLAAADLVVRNGDMDDARVRRVALTPRAMPLIEAIEARLRQLRGDILAEVSGDDLAVVAGAFGRIGAAVARVEAARG